MTSDGHGNIIILESTPQHFCETYDSTWGSHPMTGKQREKCCPLDSNPSAFFSEAKVVQHGLAFHDMSRHRGNWRNVYIEEGLQDRNSSAPQLPLLRLFKPLAPTHDMHRNSTMVGGADCTHLGFSQLVFVARSILEMVHYFSSAFIGPGKGALW